MEKIVPPLWAIILIGLAGIQITYWLLDWLFKPSWKIGPKGDPGPTGMMGAQGIPGEPAHRIKPEYPNAKELNNLVGSYICHSLD